MNKNLKTFVGLVLLALAFVSEAAAQPQSFVNRLYEGEGVVGGWSAISTEPMVLVKYTGTNANGGTVTVAAGGDITFSQGAVGASTADATLECDASIAATGSRNGIFDLSTPNAACDTLGEVVDLINNQGSNWVAVIVHGRRSDSTDNAFITLSETAANSVDGLGLLADGTVLFKQSRALVPSAALKIGFYIVGSGRTARTLKADPFKGYTALLTSLTATTTYGSGTSAHGIYCIAVTNSLVTGSETVTSYAKAAGATTVEATWTPSAYGLACPAGQKMLIRTDNSAAASAATLYITGFVY